MKKLLALLLVFAMCFGILAACGQNNSEGTEPPATTTAPPAPAEDPDLASAVAYVKNIYKTVSEKTPQDFVRVGNVPMGEKSYEVVWSVDVAEDLIKIVKNEDGSVTIDVNEEADKDTPYVLTATLTGTDGRTETLSWNHLLPASLGGNMSAIVDAGYALADGEKLDGVYTLTGKIINVDTAWSSEYKNITVTIAVEGKEDKPIMCYRLTGDDLDAVKKLAYGDTITVSGTLKNYKGTIEFDAGCKLLEVVKGDGKGPAAPETYEEIVADAYALAEGKSLPYTATLTGKVIRIDYGYSAKYGDMSLTFECRGKQFYCYRLTGPEKWLKQVGEGDWITVKGKIKNYYGTVEFDAGCKMIAYTDWNKVEGPEDQLEHIDAALKLKENFDRLPYTTELTGVITGIDTPYSSSAKNITVTMQVAGREDTPIQCYRLTGADLEAVKGLAKGDTITVTGTLMKYYEKIEFAEGCELLNVVKGEGGEEETLGNATLMTEAPKSGDIVLIWNSEAAMAATASSTKMGAVGAIPAADGTVAITADMGQLTVSVDGEYYVFSIGGKYLASTGTGNNMGLQDAIDEYAKWTLASAGDNAWYITNAGANYNGNYNQTMEYYNGFTTYGKKETDIYKMKFYYVGEGTSVEIPDVPVVPEEPAEPTTLTITEAIELGNTFEKNQYSEEKYEVTGVIESITNTTYGNLYIQDAEGNKLLVYGLYSADGSVRYDAMDPKPAVGDTITVVGIMGKYNEPQMKNGWMTKLVPGESGTPETPAEPATLTIPEAIELGNTFEKNQYSEEKYEVTGVIESITNTTFGNMYIQDAEGNKLLIYGLYNEDGSVRYDAMDPQPAVGDTITVEGVMGKYNEPQMKNGWMTKLVPGETGSEGGSTEEETPDALPSKLTYEFSAVEKAADGDYSTVSADAALEAFLEAEDNNNLKSVEAANIYAGNNGTSGAFPSQGGFLRAGSSKKAGQLVLTFTDTAKVTKVEIKCHDWYTKSESHPTNSNKVAVNGSEAVLAPYTDDATPGVLTFELDGTSNVVTIDTTNRAFIFKIVVYFAD